MENDNSDLYVYCDDHKKQRRALVCGHVSSKHKTGFYESRETWKGMPLGEDEDFEAWCENCEKVRTAEGEWNEKSEECLELAVVCEDCYFKMKAFNGK